MDVLLAPPVLVGRITGVTSTAAAEDEADGFQVHVTQAYAQRLAVMKLVL